MTGEGNTETYFPVVRLTESLRAAAAKEAGKAMKKAGGERLLSISYDAALLRTRHLLLKAEGYRVTSVGTRGEALQRCTEGGFDLVILGHSIPVADKQTIIRELREVCDTPILCMLTGTEQALAATDYVFHTEDGPRGFVERVREIVTKPRRGKRRN